MVTCSHDVDGLGMGPSVILRTPEEIKLAHGHAEVGLFREAIDQAVDYGVLYVRINFDPSSGGEDALHSVFRSKNQEIDHVAGIACLVTDAPRDFRKKRVVDARHGSDGLADDLCKPGRGVGGVYIKANGV